MLRAERFVENDGYVQALELQIDGHGCPCRGRNHLPDTRMWRASPGSRRPVEEVETVSLTPGYRLARAGCSRLHVFYQKHLVWGGCTE